MTGRGESPLISILPGGGAGGKKEKGERFSKGLVGKKKMPRYENYLLKEKKEKGIGKKKSP